MGRIFRNRYCEIQLHKQGSRQRQKISYPIHCGIYSEIKFQGNTMHFGPDHQIVRIKPAANPWCHPHEWLKLTRGGDWVYYSTGGYTGVFEATGEYYLPNFSYSTNNILVGRPFEQKEVENVTSGWHTLLEQLLAGGGELPPEEEDFVRRAAGVTPVELRRRADRLHEIIGGRVSVLPPDSRHVDYDLIPLAISRGCLYKCRFCKVKNRQPFAEIPEQEVKAQLLRLKDLYGKSLVNYNSIFLGEHDALHCSPSHILRCIELADGVLQPRASCIDSPSIFTFGSIGALLESPESLFRSLNDLPYMTYINIGFESADQETLDRIGKPVKASEIRQGLLRMLDINKRYSRIEVTGNFIMDDELPERHYDAILGLIRNRLSHNSPKGSIYFSPLSFDRHSRKQLFHFNRLKVASRLPTYLYIIQRL